MMRCNFFDQIMLNEKGGGDVIFAIRVYCIRFYYSLLESDCFVSFEEVSCFVIRITQLGFKVSFQEVSYFV